MGWNWCKEEEHPLFLLSGETFCGFPKKARGQLGLERPVRMHEGGRAGGCVVWEVLEGWERVRWLGEGGHLQWLDCVNTGM